MLMDDPGGADNLSPFINITNHLRNIGILAPEIYHQDIDNGFLLLEDLGDNTFTELLTQDPSEANEYHLYQKAIDILAHLHSNPMSTNIPLDNYDLAHFIAEARLFTDWYLPALRKKKTQQTDIDHYEAAWRTIFNALPQIEPALVLRDFHVDNLMLSGDQCAVLDYQDALIGSPAYDVISLLEDARRDIEPTLINAMKQRYFAYFPETDRTVFEHHLAVWGMQRHCKVAGIFVRLWLRDDKPVYLVHLHRVIGLINRHLENPNLAPLKSWMENTVGTLKHRDLGSVDVCLNEEI